MQTDTFEKIASRLADEGLFDMETIGLPPTPSLLEAQRLTFELDQVSIVQDVSFELGEREIMCVVGENGAGKSTLLRLLAGQLPLTSGGLDVRPGVDTFLISGGTMRSNALLTVGEYLAALKPGGAKTAMAICSDYGLNPEQPVRTLSSGEQHRLLLGSAALTRAKVTLLDVPVGELDSDGFDLAEELVRSLADAGGAVVVATTSPELVVRLDSCSLYRLSSGSLELVRPSSFDDGTLG